MPITVVFGGSELPAVTSVTPSSDVSSDAILSGGIGQRKRRIEVKGFVRSAAGRWDRVALAEAQRSLEALFAGKPPSTLEYPGVDPYEARCTSFSWDEWNGNPIIRYSATFEAEIENPFGVAVVLVETTGASPESKTFSPRPSVADAFKSPDDVDEYVSKTRDRRWTLSGVFRGSSSEVSAEQVALKEMLTRVPEYSLTVPSGVYVVKVVSFNFDTPQGPDEDATAGYSIELITLPDFTLEARALLGGSLSIAGLTFDEAQSFNHNIGRDDAAAVTSETISVSGRKFFTAMADAEVYKATVDSAVLAGATYLSATGKILVVTSVSWSTPQRDGHFVDGSRRYSMSFSANLAIDASKEVGGPGSLTGTVLGILFDVLTSVSYSVSLDELGNVVTRSKSGSGKVAGLISKTAGDSVDEDGQKFFITSLNLGDLDESSRRQVSVSGQTLDSVRAVEELFPLLFLGFFLDHHTNVSKNVSYAFDKSTGSFKPTQITASVSGFKKHSNAGVLELLSTIEKFKGDLIITSASTGAPEKKRVAGGVIEYRYPVSVSGVFNLVAGDFENERTPDVQVNTSRTIDEQVNEYARIPIPGRGIVYKRVGVKPAEETVVVDHVAKTRGIYLLMPFPSDPASSIGAGSEGVIGRQRRDAFPTKGVTLKFRRYTEIV